MRRYIGYRKPNQDRSAIERVLRIKLAPSVVKSSNHRNRQTPIGHIGEIERPLVRLRFIETQRNAVYAPGWTLYRQINQVCMPALGRTHDACAIVRDPL